ncbi:hypothetical protein ROZALSC1DRAFT_26358, partial [Rozella allomycis CSF55]
MTSENFLEYFWQLSSLDSKTRNRSAHGLVEFLLEKQAEMQRSQDSFEKDKLDFKNGDFTKAEKVFCYEINYSIGRLVTGLNSSRDAARLGFSLALTLLLEKMDFVPAEYVYYTQDGISEKNKGLKGQEEKEYYFARMFAVMVVLRARMIDRSENKKDVIEK